MAEFPALPLWTDALIGDTYHLTPAEFGAYLRLLIAAWRTPECALPNNDLFLGRAIGDPNNWHRLKQNVIPYFSIGSDGHLRQKRLTDERAYVVNKQARASAGGKAKALKGRHRAPAKPVLNECQTSAPTPTPTPTKKDIVFEDGVIRINQEDFEKWLDAFPNIDLKAELLSLSSWASTQSNWFHAVKGALAKRNRERRISPSAPKTTEDILNPTNRRTAWGLP